MTSRWYFLLVLIQPLLLGCAERESLSADATNWTGNNLDLTLVIEKMDGGEVFRQTVSMPRASSESPARVSIGTVLSDAGDYRASAESAGMQPATRDFHWSSQEGPDSILVEIRNDTIEITTRIV